MAAALTRWLMGGGKAPSPALEGRVPDGRRVYAVGDVHGRLDLLKTLVGMIEADARGYAGVVTVVFIGDYIDRGPESAGVIALLKGGLPKAWEVVYLRGNHEQAMMDFLKEPGRNAAWLSWGGIQALESYGVPVYGARGLRENAALQAELQHELDGRGHMEFLRATQLKHVIGTYAFVHAGVRANIDLNKQMENDLLFIREDFIGQPHGLPYRIVFGHTIMDEPLVEADRIGIDTGAFQSGILTAVVLEGTDVRFLDTRN